MDLMSSYFLRDDGWPPVVPVAGSAARAKPLWADRLRENGVKPQTIADCAQRHTNVTEDGTCGMSRTSGKHERTLSGLGMPGIHWDRNLRWDGTVFYNHYGQSFKIRDAFGWFRLGTRLKRSFKGQGKIIYSFRNLTFYWLALFPSTKGEVFVKWAGGRREKTWFYWVGN